MSPKRVQMTRQKPWRKNHPDAVIVARPSNWGNPFRIGDAGVPNAATAAELFRAAVLLADYGRRCVDAEPSMLHASIMDAMPGPLPRLDMIRKHLHGRDLTCWCPLDQPCHADVLLELANAPIAGGG